MKFWLFNIIYLVIDIVIVIDKEKLNKRNLRLEQSTNSADQFTEILLITDEKYRDQQFTIDQNAHSEYIHGVCWSIRIYQCSTDLYPVLLSCVPNSSQHRVQTSDLTTAYEFDQNACSVLPFWSTPYILKVCSLFYPSSHDLDYCCGVECAKYIRSSKTHWRSNALLCIYI